MLRGEEAWAETQFARSHWNQENPECAECGGAIDDISSTCVACGEPYISPAALKEREEAAAADYFDALDEYRRLGIV